MPSYIEAFSPKSPAKSPEAGQTTPVNYLEDSMDEEITRGSPRRNTVWDSPIQSSSLPTSVRQGFIYDPNEAEVALGPSHDGEEVSRVSAFTQDALREDSPLDVSILDNHGPPESFWTDPPLENNIPMADMPQDLPEVPVVGSFSGLEPPTALSTPNFLSIITSPLINTPTFNASSSRLDDGQSLGRSHEEIAPSNKILYYDINPEIIIPSLQVTRTLFQRFKDENFRRSHVFPRNSTLKKPIDDLQSEAFEIEIVYIITLAYEASERLIGLPSKKSNMADITRRKYKRLDLLMELLLIYSSM